MATEKRPDAREVIARTLVANHSGGICPVDGPCPTCDCHDPQHRYERDDANTVIAALRDAGWHLAPWGTPAEIAEREAAAQDRPGESLEIARRIAAGHGKVIVDAEDLRDVLDRADIDVIFETHTWAARNHLRAALAATEETRTCTGECDPSTGAFKHGVDCPDRATEETPETTHG